jgi:RNA polymerase primary sigma factor
MFESSNNGNETVLLDIEQASDMLGLPKINISRARVRGRLEGNTFTLPNRSRKILFEESELQRFFDSDEFKRIKFDIRTGGHVHNDEFDEPDAESKIMNQSEPETTNAAYKPNSGTPVEIAAIYEIPLLTHDQEVYLFRKMNYLKYKATKEYELGNHDDAYQILAQAEEIRSRIASSNLRLCRSKLMELHNKDVNYGNGEALSDSFGPLMKAINKFDYSRGGKFSTYLTYTLINAFIRTNKRVDEESCYSNQDDAIQKSAQEDPSLGDLEDSNAKIERIIDRFSYLDRNASTIVCMKLGIAPSDIGIQDPELDEDDFSKPKTFVKIAEQFETTQEKVRRKFALALQILSSN